MTKSVTIGTTNSDVRISNEGVTFLTRANTSTDSLYVDASHFDNAGIVHNKPQNFVNLEAVKASQISAGRIHSPFRLLPDVEKVIFSPPATVVMWADGSKTVVKTHGEDFSEEHGLAMAIARKYFGGSRSAFKRVCDKAWTPSSEEEK